MPLKPEIKAKWVEALRSGKYKQGTGALHNLANNTYCCLGVLCDLAMADGVLLDTGVDSLLLVDERQEAETFNGKSDFPPGVVARWAGFDLHPHTDFSPSVSTENQYGLRELPLAEINDNGATFSEIADLIEEQL